MALTKEEVLVKGLYKCLSMNPQTQWIDANIIRLLLRNYEDKE